MCCRRRRRGGWMFVEVVGRREGAISSLKFDLDDNILLWRNSKRDDSLRLDLPYANIGFIFPLTLSIILWGSKLSY